MRVLLGFLAVVVSCSSAASNSPKGCFDTAQTQAEMSQCAGGDFEAADAALNRVYKKVLGVYSDDPVFLSKLKEAQRSWIKFRDAELAMMYPPHDEDPRYYGSSGSMCKTMYLERLTLERIVTLKRWLKGMPEGDVCSGSIKFEDEMSKALKGAQNARAR